VAAPMNARLTRRALLQRGAAGLAFLSMPGLAAGCAGGDEAPTLRFSNWSSYIDYDEVTKKRPTLEQFTQKTGIRVDYYEDIAANASYFAKIQRPLSQGSGIDRDIIVLTETSRFPALLIDEGWLVKLDKSAIPNMDNLQDALRSPPFDPAREYSLPWQSGMTGIATNTKLTGGRPVTSVERLLEDPALKGKVTLLNNMADTVGLVMLANGDDSSRLTDATFDAALERIKKAVHSGQIRRFTGAEYTIELANGNLAAALSWSGHAVQLTTDKPDIEWHLPDSGGGIWTDSMLIPSDGDAFTASTFMNFVYDPRVAAQISSYVQYISPVKGVKEELAKTNSETASNPLIFPDQATLANVRMFDSRALNNDAYVKRWHRLIGE
jgi:spermidine/putrescine transport system substrate-binding protein